MNSQKRKRSRSPREGIDRVRDILMTQGWKKPFVMRVFRKLADDAMDDDNPYDWAQKWSRLWIEMHIRDGIIEITTKGLRKTTLDECRSVIEPLFNTCYSQSQLLDIAIEHISNKVPRNDAIQVGHWYFGTKESNEVEEIYYRNKSVRYMNCKFGAKLPASNNRCVYHATCWTWALNIYRNGINVTRGRPCLDFGLQPSFYVTISASDAIDWCRKNTVHWRGERAILVYEWPTIPKDFSIIAFDACTKRWNDLVTHSRICDDEVQNALDNADFVYGPMAANVQAIIEEKAAAKGHSPLRWQWAIKSRRAAELLNTSRKQILFFEKA